MLKKERGGGGGGGGVEGGEMGNEGRKEGRVGWRRDEGGQAGVVCLVLCGPVLGENMKEGCWGPQQLSL